MSPAKTSTGFSRDFSSAISGFRSLCGQQQRSSLKPSRSIGPAFWNLSLGAGSRFENSGLHPQYPFGVSTGPATLDRCCNWNVVAPGEYSKRFFGLQWGFMGAVSGPQRPAGCPPGRASEASAASNPPPSSIVPDRRFGPLRPRRRGYRRAPATAPPAESARGRRRGRRCRRPTHESGRGCGPRWRDLRCRRNGYRAGSTRSDRMVPTMLRRSRRR